MFPSKYTWSMAGRVRTRRDFRRNAVRTATLTNRPACYDLLAAEPWPDVDDGDQLQPMVQMADMYR
jgi:hypothetical protein